MQGGFAEREDGYIYYSLLLRHCYESFCASSEKMKKHQRRIHFSLGLSIITDTLSRLFKQKVGFGKWEKTISTLFNVFFSDYSAKEKLLLLLFFPFYFFTRTLKGLERFFSKPSNFMPSQKYFLTSELEFII